MAARFYGCLSELLLHTWIVFMFVWFSILFHKPLWLGIRKEVWPEEFQSY